MFGLNNLARPASGWIGMLWLFCGTKTIDRDRFAEEADLGVFPSDISFVSLLFFMFILVMSFDVFFSGKHDIFLISCSFFFKLVSMCVGFFIPVLSEPRKLPILEVLVGLDGLCSTLRPSFFLFGLSSILTLSLFLLGGLGLTGMRDTLVFLSTAFGGLVPTGRVAALPLPWPGLTPTWRLVLDLCPGGFEGEPLGVLDDEKLRFEFCSGSSAREMNPKLRSNSTTGFIGSGLQSGSSKCLVALSCTGTLLEVGWVKGLSAESM